MKSEALSTLSTEEDFRLATRIQQERCEDSFNQLYEKHNKLVRWQCYRYLHNNEDAEDVTQEVFAAFWHKTCQKYNGGSVKAFLCTMARHRSLRSREFGFENQVRDTLMSLDAEDADGKTLHQQLADPRTEYAADRENEVEAELDRVLLLMMPEWRLAWILRRREDYNLAEVGKIMGVTMQKASFWATSAEEFIRETTRAFYQRLQKGDDPEWLENRARFRGLFGE